MIGLDPAIVAIIGNLVTLAIMLAGGSVVAYRRVRRRRAPSSPPTPNGLTGLYREIKSVQDEARRGREHLRETLGRMEERLEREFMRRGECMARMEGGDRAVLRLERMGERLEKKLERLNINLAEVRRPGGRTSDQES